jgi:hypothetical protein
MAASRLRRRITIVAGVVVALGCIAAYASYLYLRYADVGAAAPGRAPSRAGRIETPSTPRA